jgi:hypothetical protein
MWAAIRATLNSSSQDQPSLPAKAVASDGSGLTANHLKNNAAAAADPEGQAVSSRARDVPSAPALNEAPNKAKKRKECNEQSAGATCKKQKASPSVNIPKKRAYTSHELFTNIGDVGYTFRKQFHAGWFTGRVVKIRHGAGKVIVFEMRSIIYLHLYFHFVLNPVLVAICIKLTLKHSEEIAVVSTKTGTKKT